MSLCTSLQEFSAVLIICVLLKWQRMSCTHAPYARKSLVTNGTLYISAVFCEINSSYPLSVLTNNALLTLSFSAGRGVARSQKQKCGPTPSALLMGS